MKPLQTLDHVMLWIARLFVIVCLADLLHVSSEVVSNQYWWVVRTIHRNGGFEWNRNFEGLMFPFILSLSALLALSLFRLRNDSGRLLLALSGAALFAVYLIIAIEVFASREWAGSLGDMLFLVLSLVGYFAMAWTGLRAPGQPPLRLTPLSWRRATKSNDTPPLFFCFFRHSVHSF